MLVRQIFPGGIRVEAALSGVVYIFPTCGTCGVGAGAMAGTLSVLGDEGVGMDWEVGGSCYAVEWGRQVVRMFMVGGGVALCRRVVVESWVGGCCWKKVGGWVGCGGG